MTEATVHIILPGPKHGPVWRGAAPLVGEEIRLSVDPGDGFGPRDGWWEVIGRYWEIQQEAVMLCALVSWKRDTHLETP